MLKKKKVIKNKRSLGESVGESKGSRHVRTELNLIKLVSSTVII